jgi:hypothetical protein
MSGSRFDFLSVLGLRDEDEFRSVMRGRPVTPGEVEAAAREHYRWREHVRDRDSYWVTVGEAARLLEEPPAAVRRLVDRGRIRSIVHVSGVRLMPRHDVEQLAQERTTARR